MSIVVSTHVQHVFRIPFQFSVDRFHTVTRTSAHTSLREGGSGSHRASALKTRSPLPTKTMASAGAQVDVEAASFAATMTPGAKKTVAKAVVAVGDGGGGAAVTESVAI